MTLRMQPDVIVPDGVPIFAPIATQTPCCPSIADATSSALPHRLSRRQSGVLRGHGLGRRANAVTS